MRSFVLAKQGAQALLRVQVMQDRHDHFFAWAAQCACIEPPLPTSSDIDQHDFGVFQRRDLQHFGVIHRRAVTRSDVHAVCLDLADCRHQVGLTIYA